MRASSTVLLLALLWGCGDAADSGVRRSDPSEREREREREDAAAPAEPENAVGDPCGEDADCGEGRCMKGENVTSTQYPGGYCTRSCTEASDCGERGVCSMFFRGRPGTCYRGCETDDDCRDGYRCRVSPASGVGTCVPGQKPLQDGVVGEACSSDEDCGGQPESCRLQFSDLPAPGGYCTLACAIDADCGATGMCISGVNSLNLAIGRCFRACTAPQECREGYVCQALGGTDERGACTVALPAP